jgi:hypothetical protein
VAGLLTSGTVFAYTSWLLFSALGSSPPGFCKSEAINPQWMTVSVLRAAVCGGGGVQRGGPAGAATACRTAWQGA